MAFVRAPLVFFFYSTRNLAFIASSSESSEEEKCLLYKRNSEFESSCLDCGASGKQLMRNALACVLAGGW